MSNDEKMAQVREFCNSITTTNCWDAYDLACEIRDFIDGDLDRLPV